MRHEEEFNEYLNILTDRKNTNLFSTIFFLILTILLGLYLNIEFNLMNVVSLLLILSFLFYNSIKLINNDIKLNNAKLNSKKYLYSTKSND